MCVRWKFEWLRMRRKWKWFLTWKWDCIAQNYYNNRNLVNFRSILIKNVPLDAPWNSLQLGIKILWKKVRNLGIGRFRAILQMGLYSTELLKPSEFSQFWPIMIKKYISRCALKFSTIWYKNFEQKVRNLGIRKFSAGQSPILLLST